MHDNWDENYRRKRFFSALIWITCFSCFFIISVLIEPLEARFQSSYIFAYIFVPIHRLLWGVAVALLIFGCEHLKNGKFIHKFLSSSFWMPISKLSLCIYLTHTIAILYDSVSRRQSPYFSAWNLVS
jgi:peptidoglycan/LPS O-acetylase OafA/YrhL